ncbi:hypothetical protein O1L44_06345 [Streptomyces noursei]|nr:hypothetical protein [Streptomyces noursei]
MAAVPAGTLRLGTSRGLAGRLDGVLAVLARTAPRLTVGPVLVPARERPTLVASGALDAAFVRGPAPAPPWAGCAWCRSGRIPWSRPSRPGTRWPPSRAPSASANSPASPGADRPSAQSAAGRPGRHRLPRRRLHPCAGPRYDSLDATLAAIGACTTLAGMWTVVYDAHARRLPAPGVAYLPFRNPGMELTTSLAVRRAGPPDGVDLLLRACAAAGRAAPRPSAADPPAPPTRTPLPQQGWWELRPCLHDGLRRGGDQDDGRHCQTPPHLADVFVPGTSSTGETACGHR